MTSNVPETMRATEIAAPGGPEALRPVTRPTPHAGAHDVLIRVEAAAVNFPDLLQRRGLYPPPPGASDLPGLDVAGEVVYAGEAVHLWTPGDRVCALVAGGGYAEYCVAPAQQCLPIPTGFSAVEAAALPETFFTVWANVFERGQLHGGETLLVHGGSSGIGTTAIQIARARGARVFATAGSDEKCRACETLGAERAVNYRTEDFVSVIQAATDGRGVDVVLDMVGGDYLGKNLALLAMNGRIVQIAYQRGQQAPLDIALLMRKHATVTGSTLRNRTVEQKGALANALRAQVWPLLDQGSVRPVVFATFPLADAESAHRLMETSTHIGKIVLTV